jgi:ATP phosphoribosyltransferase
MGNIIFLKPNGSLGPSSSVLLARAGEPVVIDDRSPTAIIRPDSIFSSVPIMRPKNMPKIIADDGGRNPICAMLGYDLVVDSVFSNDLKVIIRLPLAKRTRKPITVSIIGKNKKLVDSPEIKVASIYNNLGRDENGFQEATIDVFDGSIEALVACCGYDFGIDVVETGKSLKEAGLVVVKRLLVSPTVLVAHKNSPLMPEIRQFGKRLLEASKKKK